MTLRRLTFALLLGLSLSPALGQVPPPVPALPDTERRTSYSITNSTCACAVGFQLYGDSNDYANWLEVFVNGAMIPQAGNWTIASPTGSLAFIPRPITDAVLTFAQAQTGTVQIVGARRPRRASQLSENAGVSARSFNQIITDLTAQNRETWDKINDVTGRAVLAAPGETLALLPPAASRANMGACFDLNGNLTSCISIPSGTLTAGANINFTGTNPTVISASFSPTATNTTYIAPWTGSAAYPQAKLNTNTVYMTDFMGTTTCDGVTDQYASMQAFLTAVAANGAAGVSSVTGVFAPGNCFVSVGSPTFTWNTGTLPVNYHLIGYGTTITPNPANVLTGLRIVQGTSATHGDEQRMITVEGLTINAHNNSNISFGMEVVEAGHVSLRNNICYAGDDGTIHNQGNFACFYWHQGDPTDPNTGAFYGEMTGNSAKGVGAPPSVSAMPYGIRLDGSINAMMIQHNSIAQGIYGIRVFNPCATVNANCAYMANNVVIAYNDFEAMSDCIEFHTSVPTLSKLTGGLIIGNTFENCALSDIEISTITQQSTYPMSVVSNADFATTGVYIHNTSSIKLIQSPAAQWP
jgi:hypothetical protein